MTALLLIKCQNEGLHPAPKLHPHLKARQPFENPLVQLDKASDRQQVLVAPNIHPPCLARYALQVYYESATREAHHKKYPASLLSDASAAFSREQPQHVLREVMQHHGNTPATDPFVNQPK